MNCIFDYIKILHKMLEQNAYGSRYPDLAKHVTTIYGPRTRGSTTTKGIETLLMNTPIVPINDYLDEAVKKAGCRYYTCHAPSLSPKVGAISYEMAVGKYGSHNVRKIMGDHGPELVVVTSHEQLVPCESLTIILGPPNEYDGFPEGVIYTWHPGRPLLPLDAEKGPSPLTAVKLIPLVIA